MGQIDRKVTFDADGAPSPRVLAAGMQGDNHARLIRFAAPAITEGQRVYVVVESGENKDKIRLYQDDEGLWGWTISRTAMAIFGNGHAQVQVVDQEDPLDIKWQSGRLVLSIGASMDVDADLSIKYPTLIEQMQADMIATEKVVEGFAMDAAGSAQAALSSAGDADAAATEAEASEGAASEHAQNAAASAENAAAHAVAAANSAAAAAQSVAGAAEQAEAAAQSATQAAQSAADAAKSAEEAAQTATGGLDARYVQQTDYNADKQAQAATDAAQDKALEAAVAALTTTINAGKQTQAETDAAQDRALADAIDALENTIAADKQAQAAKDGAQDAALGGLSAETVKHTAQSLSDAQQQQARVNISAQKTVTISTTDLTPGTSALATGEVYLVYE